MAKRTVGVLFLITALCFPMFLEAHGIGRAPKIRKTRRPAAASKSMIATREKASYNTFLKNIENAKARQPLPQGPKTIELLSVTAEQDGTPRLPKTPLENKNAALSAWDMFAKEGLPAKPSQPQIAPVVPQMPELSLAEKIARAAQRTRMEAAQGSVLEDESTLAQIHDMIARNHNPELAQRWEQKGNMTYKKPADLAKDLADFYQGKGVEILDRSTAQKAILFSLPTEGILYVQPQRTPHQLYPQHHLVVYYPGNKSLGRIIDIKTGLVRFAPLYDSRRMR